MNLTEGNDIPGMGPTLCKGVEARRKEKAGGLRGNDVPLGSSFRKKGFTPKPLEVQPLGTA